MVKNERLAPPGSSKDFISSGLCTSMYTTEALHAVYLIPATPFKGLVLFYLLNVIHDVTVTVKIYLVT